MIDHFIQHPKKIFLLDGIGAIVSAFFLGIVLVQINGKIGMPVNVLYILASIAIFFAVFSLSCFKFMPKPAWKYLSVIATYNALYCFLTTVLLVIHFNDITTLGFIYFVAEILVLIALVSVEFKVVLGWKNIN